MTREQFKRACVFAEVWARQTTWKDVVDLIHGTAWMIGEQLQRPVNAHLVGQHDIDDMPVIRIHALSEFTHHIVFRETRILENNTTELMLGDARVEELVAERIREAKERQALKKDKVKQFAEGKIR